jgi:hypothetical protein
MGRPKRNIAVPHHDSNLRTPPLPRVRFLEAPPPELYDGDDWRERVTEWNAARVAPSL